MWKCNSSHGSTRKCISIQQIYEWGTQTWSAPNEVQYWTIFSQGLEVFTIVLCQCMPGQCLHPVCKNINQANKEEVYTSWLLAWCCAWSDSWLFCKKAKIRCSAAYKTRCTQWPVNPWKCAYGCKGKKMQVALYAKREKRNSEWVQDLQCPSVQRWLPS